MRFMVAFDGSEPSQRALKQAITLGKAAGAELEVVTVIEEPPVSGFVQWAGLNPDYVREMLEQNARQAQQTAQTLIGEAGVQGRVQTLRGRPIEVLTEAAHGVDLLVVGTHGYRGMDRILLGSVTETLLRRAEVPLLVVR
ncbi:universal stress protein [Deinococcus wulumuqiensis]|uniref:universal stress protein n=1 Tax=Deinococcus wulumuqiensis TaxID=980427 RepID=UPI0031198A24